MTVIELLTAYRNALANADDAEIDRLETITVIDFDETECNVNDVIEEYQMFLSMHNIARVDISISYSVAEIDAMAIEEIDAIIIEHTQRVARWCDTY